jgi:alpha-galactosidase
VSVVLDTSDRRLPTVLHWGSDLGELSAREVEDLARAAKPPYKDSPFDVANQINVIPEHASAWIGRPGVEGSRGGGRDWSASFRTTSQRLEDLAGGGQRFVAEAADPLAGLTIAVEIELTSVGLFRLRATLTNTAEDPYTLGALRLALPVAPQADELLDFTGRHSMERVPQRRAFSVGLHSREVTGRTGLDFAHVLLAGRAGFGFRTGQVWGVHLAWSGNQVVYGERLFNGARLLGGGELLDHGEIILDQGESYASPWLYGNYGHGLDEIAARFHRVPARPMQPPEETSPGYLEHLGGGLLPPKSGDTQGTRRTRRYRRRAALRTRRWLVLGASRRHQQPWATGPCPLTSGPRVWAR